MCCIYFRNITDLQRVRTERSTRAPTYRARRGRILGWEISRPDRDSNNIIQIDIVGGA